MSRKRRNFSPEFKARVALEALSSEQTLSELSSKYGVHPNQISTWKKKAKEGIVDSFSGRRKRDTQDKDAQVKELHAKIGQLTVENDFLCGPKSTGYFVRKPFPIRARSTKYHSSVQKRRHFLVAA